MARLERLILALALLLASQLFAQNPAPQNAAPPDAAAAAVARQAPASEPIPALPAKRPKGAAPNEEDRIAREVRHELVMQPYYTLWDWLAFRVDGRTVELLGSVHNGDLKDDSVRLVKHVEGVEKVIDHIDMLPASPMDDRIRHQVARSIFGFGSLSRYSWSAVPSIHIIVGGGRVTLEGIVDNETDKNLAFMRASGVPGVFKVTNNLKVVKN